MRSWPKPHKYSAQKTADGFPSKLEGAVYGYLQRRETLGEITDIQRQQTVVLQDGPRETKISWKIDFSFIVKATGALEYCEAKGFPDNVYKIKLKLFRANPPAALSIYGGSYERIRLIERIEARNE